MKISPLSFVIAVCSFLVSLQSNAQTPALAVSLGGPTNPSVNNQTLGWVFSVSEETTVTALGLFDDGLDGLREAHPVAIWEQQGGIVAQGTVPAGSGPQLVDNFRYAPIAATVLTPGRTYVIGGAYRSFSPDFIPESAQATTVQADSRVHYQGGKYGLGSGLVLPNAPATPSQGAYFGPNFLSEVCDLQEYSLGARFTGVAIWADTDFFPGLDAIDQAAEDNNVFVYVTHSFRPAGYTPGGTIVPPADFSNHKVGHAIDMNVTYQDGNGTWRLCNSHCLSQVALPAPVAGFIQSVRDAGLRWGGDFRRRDVVHIDDYFNANLALWREKYDSLQMCAADGGLAVQIHSPVNVLVTDPSGRRLGIDSTGTVLNELPPGFAEMEFGEPTTYIFRKPVEGIYHIGAIGTESGPFRIDVFATLDVSPPLNQLTPLEAPFQLSGQASPGSVAQASFATEVADDANPISIGPGNPGADPRRSIR